MSHCVLITHPYTLLMNSVQIRTGQFSVPLYFVHFKRHARSQLSPIASLFERAPSEFTPFSCSTDPKLSSIIAIVISCGPVKYTLADFISTMTDFHLSSLDGMPNLYSFHTCTKDNTYAYTTEMKDYSLTNTPGRCV